MLWSTLMIAAGIVLLFANIPLLLELMSLTVCGLSGDKDASLWSYSEG
jgi:hypothetical protein